MGENSVNNSVRPQNKNLNPPMKKGETINPNGRPKGQRNYKTIYLEALRKIGEANDMTIEEMEEEFQKVGLKNALKGHFPFWKDINDRVHGKTPDESKVTLIVEPSDKVKELAKKLNYDN